jgi:hypothetical protein
LKNVNKNTTNDTTYAVTYYWRDAEGNVLATESKKYFAFPSATTSNISHTTEVEYNIYGSSRLGVYQDTIPHNIVSLNPYGEYVRQKMHRQYELTNHLGNVMATVSDVKTYNGSGYAANVVEAQLYYPFGMTMPNKTYRTSKYGGLFRTRWGYQGQEMIDEFYGAGIHLDFTHRGANVMLGRFFKPDPLFRSFPWNSNYAFSENDVIRSIELEGLEAYRLSVNTDENKTKSYDLKFDNDLKPLKKNQIYLNTDNGKNDETVTTDQINSRYGSLEFPPTPAPESVMGTTNYYQWRNADFTLRADLANNNKDAPDYYLNYGDKYVKRFTNELYPNLSKEGQAWLVRARLELQKEIESGLTAQPDIELQNDGFTKFAFDTHVPAYTNSGILNLSFGDKWEIFKTPDNKDKFSINGLKQMFIIGGKQLLQWGWEIKKFNESVNEDY